MDRKYAIHPNHNSKKRVLALAIRLCLLSAFIGGCLIDIDHPLYFMGWLSDGRAFHPYIPLVGSVFIACGSIIIFTLLCRLYRKARILECYED